MGFVTPQRAWLKSLSPWVTAVLASDTARRLPFAHLERLRADWVAVEQSGAPRAFRDLWRWINLIRWAEQQEVTFDE